MTVYDNDNARPMVQPRDVLRVAAIGTTCEEDGCDAKGALPPYMPGDAWVIVEEEVQNSGSGRTRERALCLMCLHRRLGWLEPRKKTKKKKRA